MHGRRRPSPAGRPASPALLLGLTWPPLHRHKHTPALQTILLLEGGAAPPTGAAKGHTQQTIWNYRTMSCQTDVHTFQLTLLPHRRHRKTALLVTTIPHPPGSRDTPEGGTHDKSVPCLPHSLMHTSGTHPQCGTGASRAPPRGGRGRRMTAHSEQSHG